MGRSDHAGEWRAVKDSDFALYRVCWIQDGEVKKSHAQYVRNAQNRVRLILSQGQPAWLEHVPDGFDDDDVPF